jgi:cell division protein FtsL
MRILNMLVIGALVAAAAYVYKIKFDSTRQAERIAKLRMEIRQENDAIANLRAEWSKLDTPARIQELAKRHLTTLKPIDPRQFDTLRNLPERPPDLVPPDSTDPIGSLLENPDVADIATSSIPTAPAPARAKR